MKGIEPAGRKRRRRRRRRRRDDFSSKDSKREVEGVGSSNVVAWCATRMSARAFRHRGVAQ
jgi:hypothetical protein